jgi:hypothetical protein
MKATFIAIALAAAVLIAPNAAWAGRSCEARKPGAETIERGLKLAQRTLASLEASGAEVVVLARAGQDLTKYGIHYSHLGFAYRDTSGDGATVWRVVHKLNRCGTAEADVYRQGLGEFFLDDPWRYEAAWAVPSRELQAHLLPLLKDNSRAVAVHDKPYSIVSYAWGTRYQQSNQWAIETLAAAMQDGPPSRSRAQSWLQAAGYQPAILRLGPLERLGARASVANVAFDDHPNEQRFSNRIETVTADSVFQWLQRANLASSPVVIRQP